MFGTAGRLRAGGDERSPGSVTAYGGSVRVGLSRQAAADLELHNVGAVVSVCRKRVSGAWAWLTRREVGVHHDFAERMGAQLYCTYTQEGHAALPGH